MIAFSHKVNDVNLSFDISNLANCLKIKQVEIVNGNSYKVRLKETNYRISRKTTKLSHMLIKNM